MAGHSKDERPGSAGKDGGHKDDEVARQARRDLERLGEEGGLFTSPRLKARAKSVRGHFAAADVDEDDRVEVWGTRIGRGLALIAFFVLAIWLFNWFNR